MQRKALFLALAGLRLLAAADERLAAGSHGVFSPDGQRVAFQASGPKGLRVGVMTLATREVEWLTDGGKAAYPAWGPDGSVAYAFIDDRDTAWAAARNGSRAGCNLRLWKDGATRPLTAGRWRDYAPSFSPDGATVYYSSTEGEERLPGSGGQRGANIRAVAATGGTSRVVLAFESPQCAAVHPSLSPDGRLAAWAHIGAFRDNWGIAVARASAPEAFCRVTPPDMPAYAPRWLPDGRRIVCTAFRADDPGWCAYLLDCARGEMRRLAVGENPSVSPDGNTFVYDRDGELLIGDLSAALASSPVVRLPLPEALPPVSGTPEFDVSPARLPASAPLRMAPGNDAFHVACEAALEGFPAGNGVSILVRGVYKESELAFQLYVNARGIPAFAMRRADGTYAGAHGGRPLPGGSRHRLVGVRAGDTLRLYVDGRLAGMHVAPQGILAPRTPVRLVVGHNVRGAVTRATGGFGWPADIPRPPTPRELFGEDVP